MIWEKITAKLNLPAWSFLPIKVVLLICFLLIIGLGSGNLYDKISKQNDTSISQTSSAQSETETSTVTQSNTSSSVISQNVINSSSSSGAAVEPSSASNSGTGGTTVIATPRSLNGIDVSHYQGTVLWHQVAQAGIQFAFAKATGGLSYVDPHFHTNWHAMRSSEIYRGAYHFFYAADDAKKQADHFVSTIGVLSANDLPPMLDVEILDHSDSTKLVDSVIVWLESVESSTGRRPIVYSDLAFLTQYLSDPRLQKYSLWIADYNSQLGALPEPWKETGWQFWQHTGSGSVQGISGAVDQDYFFGNLDQLKYFIKESIIDASQSN